MLRKRTPKIALTKLLKELLVTSLPIDSRGSTTREPDEGMMDATMDGQHSFQGSDKSSYYTNTCQVPTFDTCIRTCLTLVPSTRIVQVPLRPIIRLASFYRTTGISFDIGFSYNLLRFIGYLFEEQKFDRDAFYLISKDRV